MRPANKLLEISGFSFPSGHTFAAASLALVSSYFLFRYFKNQRLKFMCNVLAGIFVVLIAFTRVFLRVHYLSDIVGSILLIGFLWNFIMLIRNAKP